MEVETAELATTARAPLRRRDGVRRIDLDTLVQNRLTLLVVALAVVTLNNGAERNCQLVQLLDDLRVRILREDVAVMPVEPRVLAVLVERTCNEEAVAVTGGAVLAWIRSPELRIRFGDGNPFV